MHTAGRLAAAVALLGALALSGCTSSGPAKKTSAPSSSSSSSAAPSTSAVPSSPSATPKPKPKPLSAFEADPAVQGLRKWAALSGRTINAHKIVLSSLRATETSYAAKFNKDLYGGEIGKYYPGPLPLQPLSVSIPSANTRTIKACIVADGWGQNPKTKKPVGREKVRGERIGMRKQSGRWLVDTFVADKSVKCGRVTINRQHWS